MRFACIHFIERSFQSLNAVFYNHLLDKRCLSLFLVLIFVQPLQDVLAAEYKESEKPIIEIIDDEKDPDESVFMEEPEEAITKDTVEEEALPEEEEKEVIEEPAVPEKEKEIPKPEPEAKPMEKPEKPPEKKKKPKKKVERPKGFFKGARIELKSRTVYFDRDTVGGIDQESFATGGSLMFRSGKWNDFLQSIRKYLPHRNYTGILIGTGRNFYVKIRKK